MGMQKPIHAGVWKVIQTISVIWIGPRYTFIEVVRRSLYSRVFTVTHLPLDKMAAILADGIFKHIFFNENIIIPIRISLKCVPRV